MSSIELEALWLTIRFLDSIVKEGERERERSFVSFQKWALGKRGRGMISVEYCP